MVLCREPLPLTLALRATTRTADSHELLAACDRLRIRAAAAHRAVAGGTAASHHQPGAEAGRTRCRAAEAIQEKAEGTESLGLQVGRLTPGDGDIHE
jgi:hypothetical protein